MAGTDSGKTLIPWLIILGLWMVLHGVMAVKVDPRILDGQLTGPDEYMRLIRVAELRDGGGWYDNVIERSNAPYGDALHWTRPLDVLILSGAYALSSFLSAEDALFVSGAAISPAIALLMCIAAVWAFVPLLGKERSVLAAAILLVQPAVLAYTAAGRADHHGLLFLLSVLAVGGTLRMLRARPAPGQAALAGVVYGLAIWVSVELTLLVALCQAAIAFAWIRFREFEARPRLIAAAAFFATMLLALAAEHPPAAMFTVELDRLSIPHVAAAAVGCAVWGVAWAVWRRGRGVDTPTRRAALIGAAGTIGALAMVAAFPEAAIDPLSAVDPRVLQIWNARVRELDSLIPTDLRHAGNFLYLIGAAAPCLLYAAIAAWRRRSDADSLPWMVMAVLLAAYFLLSLWHIRLAPYAEILSAPVLAEMVGRLLDWGRRHPKPKLALLAACIGASTLIAGGFAASSLLASFSASASHATSGPQCRISRISSVLNEPGGLGATPLTVAGLLDHGPEILYRTRHAVVGTPYHRNAAGIWDSYRLFAAPTETESRAIIARRGIDLLLICPSRAERQFFTQETGTDNLYTRLVDGAVPTWLAQVPTGPGNADGFRLFRVIR